MRRYGGALHRALALTLFETQHTMFTQDRPIYLQMADRLCDEILAGTYGDDDRVPNDG